MKILCDLMNTHPCIHVLAHTGQTSSNQLTPNSSFSTISPNQSASHLSPDKTYHLSLSPVGESGSLNSFDGYGNVSWSVGGGEGMDGKVKGSPPEPSPDSVTLKAGTV